MKIRDFALATTALIATGLAGWTSAQTPGDAARLHVGGAAGPTEQGLLEGWVNAAHATLRS